MNYLKFHNFNIYETKESSNEENEDVETVIAANEGVEEVHIDVEHDLDNIIYKEVGHFEKHNKVERTLLKLHYLTPKIYL